MASVDNLQGVTLVLDAGPDESKVSQLLHLSGQELRAVSEKIALAQRHVMSSVHVDRSSCTDAISDERRPIDNRHIFANLNKFCDSIGM